MAHPFEVTAEEIGQLDGTQLPRLINRLLEIESGRAGLQQSALELCDNSNIPDGGVDAFLDAGDLQANRFLPAGRSVWQYKAGSVSWQRLREEIEKQGVKDALRLGGTYVLVVGRPITTQQREREEPRFNETLAEIAPGLKIDLRSGEQIAEWATSRRAAMFHLGRNMGGFVEVERELQVSVHAHRFTPDAQRDDIRDRFRAWAEDTEGSLHFRLFGQAGVGKTRLALEAARQRFDAIYSPAPAQEAREFLQWMVAHESVSAIAVVDECSALEAEQLADRVELSNGRIRLVTVGRERIPGGDWQFPLDPLDNTTMREFVHSIAPELPLEQQVWVAELAGGYVKLARLLALETAKLGPDTPLWAMDIGQLVGRMVPDREQRRALTVVALMSHVGWEGDAASEGKLIAKALGVSWQHCREAIVQLEDQGLIGVAGRFRYATPELLAIWSAAEAWRAHGEDLLQVRQSLNADGRKRFDDRLGSMAGVDRAEEFVRDVLAHKGPFRDIDVIAANAGLFSALAKVVPEAAVRALERIILPLDVDALLTLTTGRREIMWTLERLAAYRELFPEAARLILRLAVAENESYANNATGTFQALFSPRGGATAAPGDERVELLAEIIERGDVPELLVTIGALKQVFEVHSGHAVSADRSGVAPPTYWAARTLENHVDYCGRAFVLLERLLNHEVEEVRSAAESVVLERFRNFFWLGLSEHALTFAQRSDLSESVRRRLPLEADDIIQFDDDKWFMTEELASRLRAMPRTIFGDPLRERLHLRLGSWSSDLRRSAQDSSESFLEAQSREFAELASELLAQPEILRDEFKWIVSEEAVQGQTFLLHIGEIDYKREWLSPVLEASLELQRPDLISSYVFGLSRSLANADLETLLDAWATDGALRHLVPHATASLGLSERRVGRLLTLLDSDLDPEVLICLTWSRPEDDLAIETFSDLLRRMAAAGAKTRSAAWTIAHNALVRDAAGGDAEMSAVVDLLWDLIGNSSYIGDSAAGGASYAWSNCAKTLVARDAGRLTQEIVDAVTAGREHLYASSYVCETLESCFRASPAEAWEKFATAIEGAGVGSWILTSWGAESGITDKIGLDTLRSWVDASPANRESRVGLIAKLSTVDTDLTPVIRWIVSEYGESEEILGYLMSQYGSRTVIGDMAPAEQPRLDAARQWEKDDDPAIRRWARRVVEDLKQRISKYRVEDEESLLRH